MLRAWLFGPLRARVDDDEVPPIAGLKPRAVFAWLLMHPGHHPREAVAARFWPDVLDTSARASLRSALWVVRAALAGAGGGSYLTGDRSSVGLDDASGLDVDVRHAAQLATGDDPRGWERAFALMGEPLLSDLTDDWVLEARDEYRLLAADVARRLAIAAERRGQAQEAITWTRRALARDRLDEATHRLLIARLAEAGEPAQALAAFERCRTVLRAEFGTVPSDETRALARAVRADAMTQPQRSVRKDPPLRPSTGALVGRSEQLARLRSAWERASAGEVVVATVAGAAGIGKSRLVDELAAGADGALLCRGTCAEIDGSPPFAPWSEALDAIAGLAPPPGSSLWPSELARLSTRVQQAWTRAPAGPAATPELERLRLFDAVVECLRWAAGYRPLLVILEDVHLVDAASGALVVHVTRRLTDSPVLVVLTMRPEGPATPLDPLGRADPPPERIELGALARDEASRLVNAVAPGLAPPARDEVIARGDGNPLLIVEAARARRQGTDVAEGLRSWLRPTLARLPGSARMLVDIAAVSGRPLELGEVASCVGPDQMDEAVDAACAAGFLQDRPGRRLGFVHALIRDACVAELGSGRRVWAHGRMADVLQVRPQSEASELARHLLLAGQDARARDLFARAAADARAVGALDEAAGFLREATALADRTPALAAELSLELASIEAWRGGRPAVDAAFAHGIALLEEVGDRKALASAWGHHALLLWTTLCYPREAAAAYQRCLRLLGETTDAPEIRVLALAGQAKAEALIGDPSRAAELADAVAARILPSEDPALAAEMAGARLIIALRTEPGAPSLALADRAMMLAREAGRIELVYTTAITTSSALAAHADFAGALVYTDRALASGRAGASLTAQAYAARAYALVRLGRREQARAAVADMLDVAADAVDPDVRASAQFDAGAIALVQGHPSEAIDHLERALAHQGGRLQRPLGRLYLAEAHLAAGDVERAAAALARVPFERVGPADVPATLVPRLSRLQGLIAAAGGDRNLAERRLAEAEAGWERLLGTIDIGSAYAAVIVDLGRPPLAGLVEIDQELARVRTERTRVASTGDPGRLPVATTG